MVKEALAHFGRIDILVNNAGIAYHAPILEMPVKRWDLVLKVNLRGTFLCTKYILPVMVAQGRGSIINISSYASDARVGIEYGLPYAVSKAAIDCFSVGLALEVKDKNIAVNALKPRGRVDTPGLRLWRPQADYSTWDSPDMMAKAAAFLAAQDGQGITGGVFTDEELCRRYGLL